MESMEQVGLKVLEKRENYPDIDLVKVAIDRDVNEFAKLRRHISRRIPVIRKKYVEKEVSTLFENFKKLCDFLGGETFTYHEKTEHSISCSLDKDLTITIDKTGKLLINGKSMDIPSITDYKLDTYLAIVQHVDKLKPDAEYVIAYTINMSYWVVTSSGLVNDKLVSNLPKQRINLRINIDVQDVKNMQDVKMYCVPANSPEEAITKVFKSGLVAPIIYSCSAMRGKEFQYIVTLAPIYQYVSIIPSVRK